jgi:transposase
MFVRKNKNRSGSISVQIISKENGRYRVIRTVGSATHPDEVQRLVHRAKVFIENPTGQCPLFPMQSDADRAIQNFVENLKNAHVHTIGPELIFGTLFDRIGFNAVPDELFRHIVITRLAYPTSKLKTVDYLYRYKGITISVQSIYRFLDQLAHKYKKTVERIAYNHTKKILQTITVVFYDMTTLYFEAEDEDDLRKIGFSKDGKFQKPQIMLGLLVGEGGFPIGYDIFKGNTSEGTTLIPVLQAIQKKYRFGKPIVVADAALLSKENVETLKEKNYTFIIGGRIKNESESTKQKILEKAKNMRDGDSFSITKKDGTRLLVTYSDKRAKKDAKNREKGLKRLRLRVKTGRLTKDSINNRGYNKFLQLEGEVNVTIDEQKVNAEKRWDGLKGYVTNTRLGPKRIIENYSHLWQIEKAFRISKTDLKIRPIHHYRKKRIEAHICTAFVAYVIYKELERQLKMNGVEMSAKRAGELTHNMYEVEYTLPDSNETKRKVLKMDEEQQILYRTIHK